jgi:hypothetical protein
MKLVELYIVLHVVSDHFTNAKGVVPIAWKGLWVILSSAKPYLSTDEWDVYLVPLSLTCGLHIYA